MLTMKVNFGDSCGSGAKRSFQNSGKEAILYNDVHLKVLSCFKNKYFVVFNNQDF